MVLSTLLLFAFAVVPLAQGGEAGPLPLRAAGQHELDLLMAEGNAALTKRDAFTALAAYRAVLARQPDNRAALRGNVEALSLLGAPRLALELADRTPGLIAAERRDAIAADWTAQKIRSGAIEANVGRGPGRFAGLDRALADSEAAARHALDPSAGLTDVERQLVLDRVSALRERFRMREAVQLYESMAARPAPVRAYAKSAAASAYLYLEQPEKARDLYRAALVDDPENLESGVGLFFALAECEEHEAARLQIERVLTATPAWIGAWSRATTHENPAYIRVLSARAMAPLFANRVGQAEQELQVLANQVPFNTDVRTDHASAMRARGWPRAAEEELRWVLAVDPENSGALGERAGALLELRDYRNAQTALRAAQAVAAEDGRVVRAARLMEVHGMRELQIDATTGRAAGGPTGTRDHVIESRLYSAPFGDNYRLFGHLFSAHASFDGTSVRRDRAGVGAEYRAPRMVATAELAQDVSGRSTGAAASAAFTPDDFWTVRGSVDTSTNETPLQARLAGVSARRVAGEVVWRAHESRSVAASYALMPFGDGNRRTTAQARWTERVVAGPVYKLEVTASVYASTNSRTDAPYFNPSRDLAPAIELANEWLQWRRYTRAFRHRVVVAVGNYAQQGFATGGTAALRYEQEWEADDRLTLRYGLGRTRHPYDGVQTLRSFVYVSIGWKF